MGNIMLLCARLWWFRSGPEDFPYSKLWLFIFLFANLVLALLIDGFISGEQSVPLMPLEFISYALLAVYVGIVLYFSGFTPRWQQTLTAFYGAELIANLLAITVIAIVIPLQLNAVMSGLALILYFWTLAVYSHIFRRTLSTTIYAGVLIAVTFEILRLMVLLFIVKYI